MNDRLLLAGLAGSISALAADISLYLINLLIPGHNINMPELTLNLFLNTGSYSILEIILGVIWSTVIGGTYAFIYLIILDRTGWNNLYLKAVIVINATWLLGAGFAIKLLELADYVRDDPLSITAFYIAHILFASYLYIVVKKIPKFSK